MNQLDFKGKTAVVTGGMQGIGAAIVNRLEASGAKVAIWDLDGPIVRITTPHVPLPSADSLEDHVIPSVARIVDTIRQNID